MRVCVILAWAGLMLKFCKNLAGPCFAPTYLPTYLPTLLMGKLKKKSIGEGGVLYQLE